MEQLLRNEQFLGQKLCIKKDKSCSLLQPLQKRGKDRIEKRFLKGQDACLNVSSKISCHVILQ